MITTFACDTKLAEQAEHAATITETGKYIVSILQADTYEFTAKSGSHYQVVRMLVETAQKQRQTIELYVEGSQSDYQKKMFHAILTCAHVQNASFIPANIKEHRYGVTKPEIKKGFRCRELEGKFIGILFQKVLRNYEDKGQVYDTFSMNVYRVFDAKTEQTAVEIINNKLMTSLNKILCHWLTHNT